MKNERYFTSKVKKKTPVEVANGTLLAPMYGLMIYFKELILILTYLPHGSLSETAFLKRLDIDLHYRFVTMSFSIQVFNG